MNRQLKKQLEALKEASYTLQTSTTEQRNKALEQIKEVLLQNKGQILEANQQDLKQMEESNPLYDRLMLTEERIDDICADLDTVIALEDPLNRILEQSDPPSGIHLSKVSVPLGIIGVIYESRPNVTIDVTALCLKSGNAVLLRGSSSAFASNSILTELIHKALQDSDIPPQAVQLLETDRAIATEMMKADEYLDLIIPRGSLSLIKRVREQSTVPTIETGASVVHSFVDASADIPQACQIIHNEKTRRPSVCNSVDTVLVHQEIAAEFLPQLAETMKASQTMLHCDQASYDIIKNFYDAELLDNEAEQRFDQEFLALEMNVAVVQNMDEAIQHIRQYSLKHSESIMTKDQHNAERFQREVDAACVYVNTSTAFSDGAQFGLGAEIGISTQKLHARGPMALKELCSYKWLITSDGLIRS